MAGVLIVSFMAIAILSQSLSLQHAPSQLAQRGKAREHQVPVAHIRAEPSPAAVDGEALTSIEDGQAPVDPSLSTVGAQMEASAAARQVDVASVPDVRHIAVQAGDTLTGILIEAGADPSEARAAVAALSPIFDASTLRRGQVVTLTFGELPPGAKPNVPAPEPLDAAGGSVLPSSEVAPIYAPLLSIALKPGAGRDVVIRRDADGSFAAEFSQP